ncbi:sugar-binding transcriptional regulator [Quadrisphaera setariae]|uniref:MarR family transcriptional regulator n=1 Tax=Quadrisphaera setariae TaxID=2593304 RepID=A0A5C8Z6T9_9ACTN|nr:sugar-binding domain-containing protein [Quadrisphaera setariae]TXR52650.1 MarR family transcriptional regulator [Quadrisphaera setariae]
MAVEALPSRPDRPRPTQHRADAAQLRLVTLVARMYHVRGVRQRDIATRLGLSQPRVSRLLSAAEELGVVRTVVVPPPGLHPEVEDAVEERWSVPEVHVVETSGAGDVALELGAAAAVHFSDAWPAGAVVGFTSWSTTLQAMADALAPQRRSGVGRVVELLGDIGSPLLQHEAARGTLRLAQALGAEAVFLRTPGVAGSRELRDAAAGNAHVASALGLLGALDVAFVGVGPADFHGPMQEGDNSFSAQQLAAARDAGAVAQLVQRFVDADGRPVATPLDDLVVGVRLEQLRRAGRRVVVAGGRSKHAAVRACLAGGWVDTLVTDAATAEHLLT